jgi:hypothetical protein
MTTDTPTYETKKTPMKPTIATRSAVMNLFNEALARSRMRSPQNSEARRPARRVAMQARHQQARELGNLSLYGVR